MRIIPPMRSARPRRGLPVVLVSVLVLALALLGACGLPRSSTAVQVPADDVPYGLLEATASATPSLSPVVLLVPGTIYLADAQQKLVAVGVPVPEAQAVPMV